MSAEAGSEDASGFLLSVADEHLNKGIVKRKRAEERGKQERDGEGCRVNEVRTCADDFGHLLPYGAQ